MKIIICENYEEMSAKAAEIVAAGINENPELRLGLATGSTPVGMYDNLAALCSEGKCDFAKVVTFNLDEYYKISKDNDQSYYYFMNENLFSKIDIDLKNTDIPNGEADDYEAECERYDRKIEENGGIDVQVLGIGNNGHIGFNEPGAPFGSITHMVELTESTREANKRFFASIDDVPTHAVTMGIKTVMNAKSIIIIALGKAKAEIVKKTIFGDVTPDVPASILQLHPDVEFYIDEEAAELIK